MKLVLDSSSLIALARIGRLDLLRQVTSDVHIPEAVYEEVVQAGEGRRGSVEVAQAQWISDGIRRDVVSFITFCVETPRLPYSM